MHKVYDMFDKKKYDQQFAKEKYDRIALNVAKGEKDKIAKYAELKGFDSLTDYIKFLIYKDMNEGNSSKTISVGDIKQSGDNNSISIG